MPPPSRAVALGPEPIPDKSQYDLFHPTPREWMREMVTDRPDQTESPYTVDAGHFQLEMDFFTYGQDRVTSGGADTRVTDMAVAPINLKIGLLNNLDLQFMLEPWRTTKTEDRLTGESDRQSGFGDVVSRVKLNLWGNDGGRTAFAAMPFIKIPTSQDGLGNNAVEGGLILPLGIELPLGFSLGLMTEFDFVRDEAGQAYHPEFVNSLTIGHDIVGRLGGYLEFFSQVSTDTGAEWVGMIDVGLTYGFTADLRLDCGVNIGVTPAAEDWHPFIGVSMRF